jgi:putative tryptophan/tyrosine transport system substrate-binding protein
MKRREFITMVGGAAAAWPLAARGQQPAMPVVGYLSSGFGPGSQGTNNTVTVIRQILADAVYVEGRNVAFEYRWAEGQYDRLPALAQELVRRQESSLDHLGDAPRDSGHLYLTRVRDGGRANELWNEPY